MQPDSLLIRKILLLQLELRRKVQEPDLLLLFRNHFVEKRKMIPEKSDRGSIIHLCIRAYIVLEKDGRHRRHVFMTKAKVDLGESRVARLYGWHADPSIGCQDVFRENLLGQRHRALRTWLLNRGQ